MLRQYFDKKGNIIDYYTIFNISYDAGIDEIKSAFRSLIKRYHPDSSLKRTDASIEKIDLIINGYKILADSNIRKDYNKYLFQNKKIVDNGYIIISNKRIKYSASLNEMLKARLLPKGIKRKDILYNFGQEIEILVSPVEARKGALAYIELPARMYCPICSGRNRECHVCKGMGRIATTSQLEVKISPNIKSGTIIDVDLLKIKPDNFATFRARGIRIKITVKENLV
ncbi:DnaJ domain-containing protein [Spirochaetota bacterium]